MAALARPRIASLAAGAAGAALFYLLDLPLPLLLGPMLGCLAAALAGTRLADLGFVGTYMRTFLGVAIGATITPQMVDELPGYGPTLLLVPLFVVVIGLAGYPLLRRVMGYDHVTAFYSAMPGGLQDMLIFGEEAGGKVRAMSLIHATRVLVILTATPALLTLAYGEAPAGAPGAPASEVPPAQIAIMVAAGYVGWKLAERVGLFGASILGPLILTAGLSLAGIVTTRPPAEIIWLAQFAIGVSVGAKYSGITGAELRHDVVAGLALSAMLAVLSLGFIEAALMLTAAPRLDVTLAFLPGGQAEMAVLALVTGADVAFVVAHHLARVILVILSAPWVARLLPP